MKQIMKVRPSQVKYGWQSSQPTNSVAYCRAAIEKHLHRHGCKRVLDVGCGNGAMTGQLHQAGFEMTAIEPDLDGFTIASQIHPDAQFHNVGVYDDTSHLGTFDAVISSEVIEHLYDPTAVLRLAKRNLTEGGVLIMTCPYYGYTKNLLLSLTDRWDDHHQPARVGGHIKMWSHRTMRDFLENNGFQVDMLTGAGRFWPLWASLLAVATR